MSSENESSDDSVDMASENGSSDVSIDMASENESGDESIDMASEDGDNGDGIDRISGLPDDIREFILGFLPITDAVGSSVLSRKWRYTWMKATQLNIFFDDDMERLPYCSEGDYFYRVVGNVLLSHAGCIHKFVLRLNNRSFEGDLNAWVLSLSRKGIKDLTMVCPGDVRDRAVLPSSISQCLELSCLTIENFDLKHSLAFKGCPNLVRLNLIWVDIYGDMLQKVVSSCPLKVLLIQSCVLFSSGFDDIPGITAICSPSLEKLNIICTSHPLSECHFLYTPNIRVASFEMDSMDEPADYLTSNCFDVLGSIPEIEELTFDCRLHEISTPHNIPKKLPKLLGKLKYLTLTGLCITSLDQLTFILCVIRSSPNLQSLAIHMEDMWIINEDSLKTALAFLKAEDKEETKTNITELSVTFQARRCTEVEIALIDIIVAWCPTLEMLFIKTSSQVEEIAALQLSRTVKRYRLSVSTPEIICSKVFLTS